MRSGPDVAAAPGRSFGFVGAVFAFIGVASGAIGAHALRARLDPPMLQVFETAVRYQLVHALALLIVWLAGERADGRMIAVAGWLFVAGIALFSGSLYAIALTGARAWGVVTPFGGVCLLTGWLCFAGSLVRHRSTR